MLNMCLAITSNIVFSQGILENPKDIVSYLNKKGVSVIFLFRRNTLRRLIFVLSNDYDKDAKQLNGTHKSHVHSKEEVSSMHKQFQTEFTDPISPKYPFEHMLSTAHFTWGVAYILLYHLFYGSFVILIRHWWVKDKLHLSWYYTATSYLISTAHFGQAEILAKFKPHLDLSTLITNIRNIEKAIRDCLDHFKSTRHMILYYEDIISNSNVLSTVRCPTERSIVTFLG